MTGAIVIMKVTWVHHVKLPQRRKRMAIQNNAVGLGVECTRNCGQGSGVIPGETPPHHNSTSAKFTVGTIHSGRSCSPSRLQTQTLPFERYRVNVDSSLQRTFSYCSMIHCSCSLHPVNRAALLVNIGLWAAARP